MNSLSKNIIYKFILNIFNIFVPFIIGPYALRVLGAETMANIFYSQSIFEYFFIFSCFGIYQYGIRELSTVRKNKSILRQKFTSLLIISVLASLTTILAFFIFINFKFKGQIEFSILSILSINILSNMIYVEWAIEALEEYKFITIEAIIVKSIYVVLLILLVKSPADYKIYLFLLVASSIANNLISFIYISIRIKFDFTDIRIKEHITPLLIVLLMANVNTLFTQLDKVFLGSFCINILYISYFSIPQSLIATINKLLQSILIVTIPRLSYTLNSGDKEKYEYIINKNNKVFFTLLIPIVFGTFVIADKIIILYAGYDYTASILTMRLFTIYLFTLGIEYILTNQVMYVNKKEKLLFLFISISGVINLIFKILLVKFGALNPNTAILTTIMSNIILLLLEYLYIIKYLNINYDIFNKDFVKTILVCSLFIPINIIVNSANLNMIVSVILIVVLCISIYSIYLFIFNKQIVREIINSIMKNKE